MDEPYFIEVDNNGCNVCQHDRTWCIIGPDGVASSISYDHSTDAADMAEQLNAAYSHGYAAGLRAQKTSEVK